MKIDWKVSPYTKIRVGKFERIMAARAIATWDPEWRNHLWAAEVEGPPFRRQDQIEFSYRADNGWLHGPVCKAAGEFDLQFRLWYERTYPLPEGYQPWMPDCKYCGEHWLDEKKHLQFCIGLWAWKLDMRGQFPFGVFPSTDPDRYRKEIEVVQEIIDFGFRVSMHNDKPVYWKHILKPASQVLLDNGYLDIDHYWVQYWVKRERKRAIRRYARIRHLEGSGYSYYSSRGSLTCSVRIADDGFWHCWTPSRQKLPHGFEKPSYAVAFYYPWPGTMLANLRRYAYESRWPFARSKIYKRLRLAA